MKKLIVILSMILVSFSVTADSIDENLQAVITSSMYPPALGQAKMAVEQLGVGYQLTLGETSSAAYLPPQYFYYIPVFAVKVPLSSTSPRNVGNIIGVLFPAQNEPLPTVESVTFAPSPIPASL